MRPPTDKKKVHKICIWLDDEEKEKVYKVVYKEKTIPSKIFRKALMDYVEKSLLEEDKEPIIL
jgi:predicted transcriptional regulator